MCRNTEKKCMHYENGIKDEKNIWKNLSLTWHNQGIEKGIEKGELRKAKDTALSMALDGMKIDKIAQYLKVNPKLVQEWIGETVIE